MPFKTNFAARGFCIALLVLLSSSILAQKTVTGKVTSSLDKQPLAGATVQVKGTKILVQANQEGLFTITSPKDIGTLVITVVGFQPMQYPVAGRADIGEIQLISAVSSLNDVIVTGYTSQKKKDVTGSVAVVNVGDMKTVPAGNVENQLQGQAAGVTITSSGAPGGYSDIKIRGLTSMGNITPLVVVDGVESINGMHDLNVNDIESMQVLKDAAAAIYGVRGSNGVIIITTKKGKSGKPKVTYDMYYGTQRPLKANPFDLANTQQTAEAYWQMAANAGAPYNAANPNAQYGGGSGPVVPYYITPAGGALGDPAADPSKYVFDPGASDDNRITKANQTGTDWFRAIFSPAAMQSHNITASGSGDRSTYLFSFNYVNQQGTLYSTYLKRYGVRANTTFNIKDHIRVGENAYVFYKQNPTTQNQNEGNLISYAYREQVIIPIYDIKGNFAGTGSSGLGNSQNPYADAFRSKSDYNKQNDWQMVGNVFAEADFLKHFTVRSTFGGTVENYYSYQFNQTGYENAEGNTNPNSFTENSGYNTNWTWTNTLTYSNEFGKSNVKGLLGQEAVSYYGRNMSASRSGYFSSDPAFLALNSGLPGSQANSGAPYTDYTISSYFARVDYGYEGKYLLSGTIRRDGSSVFGPATPVRFGWFPSVQAAWRLSQEDFMKSLTFVNDLKIRASYGRMGSLSNVPYTNQYSLYGSSASLSYYDINGTSNSSLQGFYQNSLGNPNTTWETDIVSNVGFDATLLNNKFSLSFDLYKKAVSGLLFQLPIAYASAVGAASNPYDNVGNIQNTGVDVMATYHGNVGRDFKFDVGLTFTSYKNIIKSLPSPGYIDQNSIGSTRINNFVREEVGQPVGEFFGYKVIGLFQSAADVAKSPTQDGAAPGFFKYKDVDGDGAITPNDRTWLGNPNPKFTYGVPISASYKNFDFSVFFYGSYGNQDFNYVKYWTDFPQVFAGAVSKRAALDGWTPTNTNTSVPILTTVSGFSNTTVVNSYYVESGAFLKCKQLQFGYTLPVTPLKRIGVDKFRVYVQATNLFMITKYDGLDPELQSSAGISTQGGSTQGMTANTPANSSFGIDFGNYPNNQRSFLVGVSLTF